MAESGNERAQRKRKILEDEGMTQDRYNKKMDELEQEGLDVDNIRDLIRMLKKRPTTTEDAKVQRISERIEAEEREAEERKAGTHKHIRWVTIFDDRLGGPSSMEVEVDEGSVVNLITKGIADDRGFKIQSLGSEPFRGETVNGEVVCEEYVELTLVGKEGQSIAVVFHVIPANEPPNNPRITKPLVGRGLVTEPGGVLLSDDPKCPIWSTKMGKANAQMQERAKEQAAKVQAYQTTTAQTRDAGRKDDDRKDHNQRNKGTSSGTKNEESK